MVQVYADPIPVQFQSTPESHFGIAQRVLHRNLTLSADSLDQVRFRLHALFRAFVSPCGGN